MSNAKTIGNKSYYQVPDRRIGRKPNWRGVSVSLGSKKLFDNTGKPLPGVKIHGAVTRNHASTITQKKNYKDEDGNVKSYEKVVGSTHELPNVTQSTLATILNDPQTKAEKAIYLYDKKTTEWQNDKETGISTLIDVETGEVLKTVIHNYEESK